MNEEVPQPTQPAQPTQPVQPTQPAVSQWPAQVQFIPQPQPQPSSTTLILASIWLAITVIVGFVFIFGIQNETYGGDAYTGLQNAMATAVHALGFVIIGTGVGPFISALSSRGK